MSSPLPRGKTGVLVISPTRELAAQIAEEAKVLATFHKLTVQARHADAPTGFDCEDLSSHGPDHQLRSQLRLMWFCSRRALATLRLARFQVKARHQTIGEW